MTISPRIDPFNLVGLTEEIEKECIKIATKDLPEIVDVRKLDELKRGQNDEIKSLFAEWMKDYTQFLQQPEIASRQTSSPKIPTLQGLAALFPTIYSEPMPTGSADDDNERTLRWCIDRVLWVASSLLQMWGQLISLTDPTVPSTTTIENGVVPGVSDVAIPRPYVLERIIDLLQIVKRLSLEYLQAKCDVFALLGETIPHIEINIARTVERFQEEAREAFLSNSLHASVTCVYALRVAVFKVLKQPDPSFQFDWKRISTGHLTVLAMEAGVKMPFSGEVLANILFMLETLQADCAVPLPSMLYPMHRIIDETIRALGSQTPDDQVCREFRTIIERKASGHASVHP